MKASLEKSVSVLDRLVERLDELERRLAALEHPEKLSRSVASTTSTAGPACTATAAAPAAIAQGHPLAKITGSTSVMPLIGKVFLGVAGAYLLRALAESGIVPMWSIAVVALAYAGTWLWWAARTPPARVFAGAAYSTTAAGILSPMLWELTLRFKVMPSRITATALVGFAFAAVALAWKRRLASVVWTPTAFVCVTAFALFVGTRDPFPFTMALLLVALITESAAVSDRWPSLRPLVSAPLDLTLLALIIIYTGSNGASPEYRSLSSAELLTLFAAPLLIYSASVLSRTVVLRRPVGIFEAGQMMAAFLLACVGILRTTHYVVAPALGVFCLLTAAGFYWLAFTRFENMVSQRNRHVFSAWAVALALAGTFLCFPANAAVVWLGLAAVAATLAGVRFRRFSVAWHGALYLAAIVLVSGLFQYFAALLLSEPPRAGAWPVWAACVFIGMGYALAWRGVNKPAPPWQHAIIALAFATLAAGAALALALTAGLSAFPATGPARVAAVRTFVICLLVLALGWSGSRWKRTELIWLAYAFLALCTLKLLFEDLRTGSAQTLAFSLFCYGMVWMLVPRFARARKAG